MAKSPADCGKSLHASAEALERVHGYFKYAIHQLGGPEADAQVAAAAKDAEIAVAAIRIIAEKVKALKDGQSSLDPKVDALKDGQSSLDPKALKDGQSSLDPNTEVDAEENKEKHEETKDGQSSLDPNTEKSNAAQL